MINTIFFKQMELLVEILPFVALEDHFILKGGTAINLFIRNLPRLSVDIDLTYGPIEDRGATLKKITEGMLSLENNLKSKMNLIITRVYLSGTSYISKLLIQKKEIRVKVEINLIQRGHVFPCQKRTSCEQANKLFSREVLIPTLSFEDIYAGKLCAALERQHPRDLFDVQLLMKNEGITDSLWQAFLVYLSSCNRPIHEMISPNLMDIRRNFNKEFLDMSAEVLSLEEIENTRENLINEVQRRLQKNGADFLISLLDGEPIWDYLNISHVHQLPGLKWKLFNIKKMDVRKRKEQLNAFLKVLESA